MRTKRDAVWLLFSCLGFADCSIAQSPVAIYSNLIGAKYDASTDEVRVLATDQAGDIYLGGVTRYELTRPDETGFPTTPTSLHLPNPRDPSDPCNIRCGFLLKLDRNLEVVFGAILPMLDVQAMAVDSTGSVYAAGHQTSLDPSTHVTPGAFSTEGPIFLIKLTPDGSALDYGALFWANEVSAIAVDDQDNAYVYGGSWVAGLPTTPNAVKPQYVAADNNNQPDAFLIKVDPTGSNLIFGTYLGGTQAETAYGMIVDGAGRALVTGDTRSIDFQGLPGPNVGLADGYVMHVAADGSAVVNGRYFGGSADEFISAIASSTNGGFLVAAQTESPDLPVTQGVIQPRMLGKRNGWIARLDPSLDIVAATYFGGSFIDGAHAIASDGNASIYVSGPTWSSDILTSANGFQDSSATYATSEFAAAGRDFYPIHPLYAALETYFAVLDPDLTTLEYGTYLGGSYPTFAAGSPVTFGTELVRTPQGDIYVGGFTDTENYPATGDGLHNGLAGSKDGFLARFISQDFAIVSPTQLPPAKIGEPFAHWLAASGGAPPYVWSLAGHVLPDGLALSVDGVISGIPDTIQAEPRGYQFTVRATDSAGRVAHKSMFLGAIWTGLPECAPNYCRIQLDRGTNFVGDLPFPARGVGPYTLHVSGELPPDLEIYPSQGIWSGRLSEAGIFRFALTIEDDLRRRVTLDYEFVVTVNGVMPAPADPTQPLPADETVVLPPRPPSTSSAPSPGGGGGGGGAFALQEVLLLLCLAALGSCLSSSPRRPKTGQGSTVSAREGRRTVTANPWPRTKAAAS